MDEGKLHAISSAGLGQFVLHGMTRSDMASMPFRYYRRARSRQKKS